MRTPRYPRIADFVHAVLDGSHLYAGGESPAWTGWSPPKPPFLLLVLYRRAK